MAKTRILIVEDDPDIGELEKCVIEEEGYVVDVCATAEDAQARVEWKRPDLVVLDLMLPGQDGLAFCQWLRRNERTATVPVIIVSARQESAKIVAGLELGADDYVTKPFSPDILAARVRALLRRTGDRAGDEAAARTLLSDGVIEIDASRMRVTIEGTPLNLTLGEFKILELLVRRSGIVFSRKQIVDLVHGEDYPVTDRAVDVQIVGLRRKLGAHASLIETIRGIGYRWRQ